MRAKLLVAASGFLLASGAAQAAPGIPNDDTVYADDVLASSKPRWIPVTITEHGPQPRFIPVQREKVELVVTRASPNACRSELVVEDFNVHAAIPAGKSVVMTVTAQGAGQLHLMCPAEDLAP